MAISLLPRKDRFFVLFEQQADLLVQAARKFREMMEHYEESERFTLEIKEIEHRADVVTHEIFDLVNKSFVTPIDREDIHALAKSLDDVMDAIDASAKVIRLYRIASVRFGARELARVVSLGTDEVQLAVQALEKRVGVSKRAVEINRLENEADDLLRDGISRLFAHPDDPRDIVLSIKWREIYEFLEIASDKAEDAANVLEGIVIKHA